MTLEVLRQAEVRYLCWESATDKFKMGLPEHPFEWVGNAAVMTLNRSTETWSSEWNFFLILKNTFVHLFVSMEKSFLALLVTTVTCIVFMSWWMLEPVDPPPHFLGTVPCWQACLRTLCSPGLEPHSFPCVWFWPHIRHQISQVLLHCPVRLFGNNFSF
jgi:hypothetical protein